MGARKNSGRKIIPMEVKKAKGTYRKDRDPKIPPPSKDAPVAPEHLSTRQKEIFDQITVRLHDTGGDSSTFTEIHALCAICLAEVEECNSNIIFFGSYYDAVDKDGAIIVRENPAVKRMERSRKAAQSLLAEMALTRVTAPKVGGNVVSKPKGNAFEDI